MRGYFGIGSEGISKAMNLGAVMRTAHAFGASFAFTVDAHHKSRHVEWSDTSRSGQHMPLYAWSTVDDLLLPKGCMLIGIELDDTAIALPTFRHPLQAAYILGPEKGSLSASAKARCQSIVAIPTRFCVNLSIAASIVMYDRMLALGGYGGRDGAVVPDATDWHRPKPGRGRGGYRGEK